jgi:hypothetical protein
MVRIFLDGGTMKRILKMFVIIVFVIGICGCKGKKVADSNEKKPHPAKIQTQMVQQDQSDANARAALITKIKAQPEAANLAPKTATADELITALNNPKPFPVVSLEDFFEGNKDLGSIGCNLTNHPGIPKLYEVLKGIRAKDNVQDVLIEIYEIDDEYADWPFSENVYILTSASKKEVEKWMEPLQPDEIFEGWRSKKPPSAAPKLKDGMKVLGAWWD